VDKEEEEVGVKVVNWVRLRGKGKMLACGIKRRLGWRMRSRNGGRTQLTGSVQCGSCVL
jgi:hypothetical protein